MQREFFDDLAKRLEIKDWKDWNKVRIEDIVKNRGSGLISEYYGYSIQKALQTVYPDINWKTISLAHEYCNNASFKSTSRTLKSKIHLKVHSYMSELFKDTDVLFNYKLVDGMFRGVYFVDK